MAEPRSTAAKEPVAIAELVEEHGASTVRLTGVWAISTLVSTTSANALKRLSAFGQVQRWDLTQIEVLDHMAALHLMRVWGGKKPETLLMDDSTATIFKHLDAVGPAPAKKREEPLFDRLLNPIVGVGSALLNFYRHLYRYIRLLGQVVLDLGRLISEPSRGPWREISANIYRAGAQALPITALVGCLIGIVLSYLSARQLKAFGAGPFIVDLLGTAIIRELGPMLAAILVAGRSGSAMTAQIGVMRVTEELDALKVMGIPHSYRLVMPKVIALAIAMPLIAVWTDVMALLGGIMAAQAQLGLGLAHFMQVLPNVVPVSNYWLGIGKSVVFGMLIALTACHFGLRIAPNTESLARYTTSSVVASITIVILVDAIFAIVFSDVGI
jgi:phospholipid/cholesterol/gamma-HCH transport system permease protein